MRTTENHGEKLLRELRETEAKQRRATFDAAEKTGFLKVGTGKAVPIATAANGDHTLCGAEGVGSGQVRFNVSSLKIADGPATYKRCLKTSSIR